MFQFTGRMPSALTLKRCMTLMAAEACGIGYLADGTPEAEKTGRVYTVLTDPNSLFK